MARINVSVPDELKARMDEVGEAANWSAIAQRAFGEAVANHFMRKDSNDMSNVIERLRASKARVEASSLDRGRNDGELWAKEEAEWDELLRLVNGSNNDVEFTLDLLQTTIDTEGEESHDWREFWSDRDFQSQLPDDQYARGFVDGAMKVYGAVAHQL